MSHAAGGVVLLQLRCFLLHWFFERRHDDLDCVRSVRALSVGLNNVAQSPGRKRARIFRSALVLAIKTS